MCRIRTTPSPPSRRLFVSVQSERSREGIDLLIVDDHAIIRRGIREVVCQHWPASAIDEAASMGELFPALLRARPEIVLLDLHLGNSNAIDVLADVHERFPRIKVLVYSMSAERVFAQQVIARGASGFLSKATDERDLIAAIELVLAGGTYVSPELLDAARQRQTERSVPAIADPFEDLSERERRVMDELLTGAGVKEIAARLNLQPTTVATYKARLYDKLGVSNLLDLQAMVTTRMKPGASLASPDPRA